MPREDQQNFGREFQTGPSPRQLELLQKKDLSGLTNEEEGEIRGLFAHPNDPEAQALVKLKYLSSEKLAEMTAEQKERLRVIRAEAWKTRSQIERTLKDREVGGSHEKPKADDGLAARAELDVIHTQGKIASLSGKFEGEPKKRLTAFLQKHQTTLLSTQKIQLA